MKLTTVLFTAWFSSFFGLLFTAPMNNRLITSLCFVVLIISTIAFFIVNKQHKKIRVCYTIKGYMKDSPENAVIMIGSYKTTSNTNPKTVAVLCNKIKKRFHSKYPKHDIYSLSITDKK